MDKNLPISCQEDFQSIISIRDRQTFDLLFDCYGCLLYGLAQKSLPSTDLADKITELAFMNIWHSLDSWNPTEASFKIWIITVLIETIKDHLKLNKIHYTLRTEHFPDFYFEL